MRLTKPLVYAVCVLAVSLASLIAKAQSTQTLAAPEKPAEAADARQLDDPPMPLAVAAKSTMPAALAGVGAAAEKVETVVERYPNGHTKIERQVIQDSAGNYVNQGTYTMYDLDGQALKVGEFRNGKQVGKWTQHFAKDEGNLFSTSQDKDFAGPFVTEATFVGEISAYAVAVPVAAERLGLVENL